jgi:hypothetical protein
MQQQDSRAKDARQDSNSRAGHTIAKRLCLQICFTCFVQQVIRQRQTATQTTETTAPKDQYTPTHGQFSNCKHRNTPKQPEKAVFRSEIATLPSNILPISFIFPRAMESIYNLPRTTLHSKILKARNTTHPVCKTLTAT